MKHVPVHNQEIPALAAELVKFSFVIYGFNSGHFLNRKLSPPIDIVMSADVLPSGRAMFKQHAKCPKIADSAIGLLQMVVTSKAKSTIHGFCIHSHKFKSRDVEEKFWTTQANIITVLRDKRGLQSLLVFIHNSYDYSLAKRFRYGLKRTGWAISSTDI